MELAKFLSSSGTKQPAGAPRGTRRCFPRYREVEGSYILMMSDESWIVVDNSAEPADPQSSTPGPPRQTLPLKIE